MQATAPFLPTPNEETSVDDIAPSDTTVDDIASVDGVTTGDFAAPSAVTNLRSRCYKSNKTRYRTRLRRIEGQVRGVARMVDEEQHRMDILTQLSALTAALRSLALGLIDDHMKHCVLDAARHDLDGVEARNHEASAAAAGQELEQLHAEGAKAVQLFLPQICAHHEALEMARQEDDAGSNPESVALANTFVKDQDADVQEMKDLLAGL